MNDRNQELMQRVLDGEAKADEVARLQALLAGDETLQQSYADLERVFQSLAAVHPVEPPPDAKAELLQRLRLQPPRLWSPGRTDPENWVQSAVGALRKQITPSLAYAFAAGGIAGVALFGSLGSRIGARLDGAAPGSMLPPAQVADARLLDTVPVQGPGFTATLRSTAHARGVLVEVDCRGTSAATVDVGFDAAAIDLLGFEQDAPAAAALEPGRVRIHHAGEHVYRLWLAAPRAPAPLEFRIEAGGAVLEAKLRTTAMAP